MRKALATVVLVTVIGYCAFTAWAANQAAEAGATWTWLGLVFDPADGRNMSLVFAVAAIVAGIVLLACGLLGKATASNTRKDN